MRITRGKEKGIALPTVFPFYINLTIMSLTAENLFDITGNGLFQLWARFVGRINLFVVLVLSLLFVMVSKLSKRTIWIPIFTAFVLVNIALLNVSFTDKYRLCRDFLLGFFIPCWTLVTVDDFETLTKSMSVYMPLLIICSISELTKYGTLDYDMTYSYTIIPLSLMMLYIGVKSKSITHILAWALSFFTTLLCGARGSLLCHILFSVLLIWSVTGKPDFYKVALFVFATCAIGLGVIVIMRQNPDLWQHSRSLRLLLDGKIFYQSGREQYHSALFGAFSRDPLRIRGLYSDRLFMAGIFREQFHQGIYAHNLIRELLFDFGVWSMPLILFGSIQIIRSIALLPVAANSDDGLYPWILIGLSYALGQLMISSSFLVSPSFGLLCGALSSPLFRRIRPTKQNRFPLRKI